MKPRNLDMKEDGQTTNNEKNNGHGNETIYGITPLEMDLLMQAKKESSQKKGKYFYCYVLPLRRLGDFLSELRSALDELPNGCRFQIAIAVKNSCIEHWYLMDCFKNNGVLNTFTVESFNLNKILKNHLAMILDYFPTGQHYYFDGSNGAIQYSSIHCQTFTREQIGLISSMPPKELYELLAKHTIVGLRNESARMLTLIDFNKPELRLLVPLIRSIQSLSSYERLSSETKNANVSHKGDSFEQWIQKKKVYSEAEKKNQNHSIVMKDISYAKKLTAAKVKYGLDSESYLQRTSNVNEMKEEKVTASQCTRKV